MPPVIRRGPEGDHHPQARGGITVFYKGSLQCPAFKSAEGNNNNVVLADAAMEDAILDFIVPVGHSIPDLTRLTVGLSLSRWLITGIGSLLIVMAVSNQNVPTGFHFTPILPGLPLPRWISGKRLTGLFRMGLLCLLPARHVRAEDCTCQVGVGFPHHCGACSSYCSLAWRSSTTWTSSTSTWTVSPNRWLSRQGRKWSRRLGRLSRGLEMHHQRPQAPPAHPGLAPGTLLCRLPGSLPHRSTIPLGRSTGAAHKFRTSGPPGTSLSPVGAGNRGATHFGAGAARNPQNGFSSVGPTGRAHRPTHHCQPEEVLTRKALQWLTGAHETLPRPLGHLPL